MYLESKKLLWKCDYMQGGKIIRNRIKCKECGDIIESKTVHDFVSCSCGACSVDGGTSYLRRLFTKQDCYEDLSETRPYTEEELQQFEKIRKNLGLKN